VDDSTEFEGDCASLASPSAVTLEGPTWRRPRGAAATDPIDVTGDRWRVPAGLGCPYCPGSPPLTYLSHVVYCPPCDSVLQLIDAEAAARLERCRWCGERLERDGCMVWCRNGDGPTHDPRPFLIAEPVSGGPCADCGEPRDIAGTGTLCRRCVLASYLELRLGHLAARAMPGAPPSRWLEVAGFLRDADVGGHSATLGDDLSAPVTPFTNAAGIDDRSRWEHYAVASDRAYGGGELANGRDRKTLSVRALTAGGRDKEDEDTRSGQMLTAGVRGGPHAGHVLVYRLTDSSGLVYEAALPVGDIDEPESAPHATERGRTVRDLPYLDRVIVGHDADSRREPAFKRAARRWLRNELPKTGRPPGRTDWTREYWYSELDRARVELRRDHIGYSEKRLSERMRRPGAETDEVPKSTFTRNKKRWGLSPPVA